ncbi:MAG: hypothetical protein EKK52_14855 [Burkholderiales bacterium]|nr:MAG: hypothetical protein EKK52_14855 [Burkholderiales bacterium]
MERLAEQIVDWHNRHPLARRVRVDEVHSIGVVALPFVRASAQASGVVEPVLTDVVSAFDAIHEHTPPSRGALLMQRMAGLMRRLNRRPRTQWRAFNEKFLPGLSPARVERFALEHGFSEPPAAPETRPWRVVVIDEAEAGKHEGWPFELYLMTAAIDAKAGRSRLLAGRGIPSQIIGRRIWDPLRLGAAAGVLSLAAGGLGLLLWSDARAPAAPQASPADGSGRPASAPLPASAAAPAAAASTAAAAEAASAAASMPAAMAASSPASSPGEAGQPPASAPEPEGGASAAPDIRPRLVQRVDGIERPPLLRSGKPAAAQAAGPASAAGKRPGPEAGNKPEPAADLSRPLPADPLLARMASKSGQTVVALVGPPGSKAEAEALLARMKAGLAGVHGDPQALQADVIQTPEGWRATVWPFASREQAQLINATLVARGMKTKAVNF